MVRGATGFWGAFEAQGFKMILPPSGSPVSLSATVTATPTATSTQVAASSTPTPSPTAVRMGAATSTPTATPPSLSGNVTTLVFDDLPNPNRALTGSYGPLDFGTTGWYLAGPYDQFKGNSISFNGAVLRSATIGLAVPLRVYQVDADNGSQTVPTTVTLACPGQPSVQVAVDPGQRTTIRTGWTTACSSVTVSSTNGWHTNFKNLVLGGGSGTTLPTSTPSPTPTARPTVTPATQTIVFDDLVGQNRPLSGQYPAGLITWTGDEWFLAPSVGKFSTKSITLGGGGQTSGNITFVAPRRLVSLDVYNRASTTATIRLSCAGQPTRSLTVDSQQVITVSTNWTAPCSNVIVSSTAGRLTNFDNLVVQ
jgi:hypothetical protein